MANDVPFWLERIIALGMAWAWSIIAFGTAINAVVKSNHQKAEVRALAPTGTQVDINDNDIFSAGAVITAVCIVIFVLTSLYLAILLIRPTSFTRPRLIAIQGGVLAFFAAFLFAALVPYTHFFRTRSAGITASIRGLSIPQSVVDSLINSIGRQNGLSPEYKTQGYLRLVAILPWITLLFTIIASATLYIAASRTKQLHHAQPISDSQPTSATAEANDKADSPVTEKVNTSAA
ncbi:hypothetical protein NP233_g1364 [Leucocoprinus birnbaumii]|uniref:Uncharacterized protein n=1 Tax=Leucocoprinus birnbaumii TaxID=56174 RepID=A0AAD5YY11_9AGAR|nr:hypothetical protein NP233_g1364 [Leucocoprinus birnbaumii]